MDSEIREYRAKAEESLAGAESDVGNRRYNNAANRCYYACFQAAIAALLGAGIRPADPRTGWGHAFVQAQYTGQLVNRRKLYPPELRDVLERTYTLRQTAHYRRDVVSAPQARRALRRAQALVHAVPRGGERV